MSNKDNNRCSSDLLFRSIIEQDNVFYKSLSRDDPELEYDEKYDILHDLFESRPDIFLQRYHQFVSPCMLLILIFFI